MSASAKSYLLSLCESQDWDAVRSLLADKKKVKKDQLTYTSDEGLTCLAHACLEEVIDVVELLLKAGADPMAGDPEGTNCLHIAATLSNGKLLKLLLEGATSKKVDPNKADKAGSAPLHLAVEPSDENDAAAAAECVTVLLGHGANASLKNSDGQTAADLAKLPAVKAVLELTGGRKAKKTGGKEGNKSADADTPGKGARRVKIGVESSGADELDPPTSAVRRRRPGTGDGPGVGGEFSDPFGAAPVAASESDAKARRRARGSSRSSAGRGGVDSEDLASLIEEHGKRVEQQLTEALNMAEGLGGGGTLQYDVAIALFPAEYAGLNEEDDESTSAATKSRRAARKPTAGNETPRDDADDLEGGENGGGRSGSSVTRSTLLQRVRAPACGLHS